MSHGTLGVSELCPTALCIGTRVTEEAHSIQIPSATLFESFVREQSGTKKGAQDHAEIREPA